MAVPAGLSQVELSSDLPHYREADLPLAVKSGQHSMFASEQLVLHGLEPAEISSEDQAAARIEHPTDTERAPAYTATWRHTQREWKP